MRTTDPATMSASERLGEIAGLLAIGFQRLVEAERKAVLAARNPQNPLDASRTAEAQSCSMVHSPQSTEAAR